jgi:hypothetical protein
MSYTAAISEHEDRENRFFRIHGWVPEPPGITVLAIDYACVELGGGGIHCSPAPLARDPI